MNSDSSSKVELVAFPKEDVDVVWPIVEPLLAKATRRTRKVDTDDVLVDLRLGTAQLWAVWDVGASRVRASLVTHLLDFPSGYRACQVLLLGGEGAREWIHLIERIEEYARAERCDSVELVGRRGWGKMVPDYSEIETTFSKEV